MASGFYFIYIDKKLQNQRLLKQLNRMFKLLSSTSLILFLSFSTYAQTGTLDTQFGNAGKAVTDFHSSDIVVASMIQPDNKIVVAGTTNATAPLDSFALVRYQTNGALD